MKEKRIKTQTKWKEKMKRAQERWQGVLFAGCLPVFCLTLLFCLAVPLSVQASENRTVRVGYYERENFQEGMDDHIFKRGYCYEYLQRLASFAGWKYAYVYGEYEELLCQLENGEIDLLGGVPFDQKRTETLNYSAQPMLTNEHTDYYFCTAKMRTDLVQELNAAQEAIYAYQSDFNQKLWEKYHSRQEIDKTLLQKEQAWAKTHTKLRLGYMTNYLPYSDTTVNGEVTGLVCDVVSEILQTFEIEQQTAVSYAAYDDYEEMVTALQNGELDAIFPAGSSLWYAEQHAISLSAPVVTSYMNLAYMGSYSAQTVARIGVNRFNSMQYYYTITNYPDAEIVFFDSTDACLEAVLDGTIGSTILNALRTNMILRNSKYKAIVSSQVPRADDMCFAVAASDVELLRLLDDGIEMLGSEYGVNASYMYVGALYEYSMKDFIADYWYWFLLLFCLLIALLVCYFVNHARNLNMQAQEAKRHKQELTDALEAAQHANRAKTNFLNNMSHDIRTPMNAIIGFTTLAVTHIDSKEQVRDYLGKIMTSSNHLLSLINDMLDMSRIESGQVKIDENECHLPTIMHDLRNILQSDVRAKRLDFFIDTVDVVDEDIICDKLRLNQVLLNCMSNAIKFTKPGGTVGIRIMQKSGAPDGYANFDFVVKDNGIGMSPQFAQHMFEPFTREETTTVSGIPGTGLGMSITKYIVDMMGGTIAVKSEKGAGTEITVSLSFRLGDNPQRVKVIKNLAGLRALVADDSMDTCVSVSRMLESIGMSAEWTMSGVEAAYKAKYAYEDGKPYKAFIIDWLMPDMNGVEVVRRIRADIGNDTPIIVLTAYDWADIEAEAREAGVTAFCAKPLFLSDLYEVLTDGVEVEQHEREIADFSGKRVLLVEDNELNMEIAREIIGRTGVTIELAENGKIAVDQVRLSPEGYYDLIFMDIQMPVMDGYEATRQIRKLNRSDVQTLPIVAMTANAFVEDRQSAYDSGMNEHTAKPIEIDALYGIMKKYLM